MDKSELTPIKIYVVGPSKGYANWISDHLTDDLKEANLVLLTGGEDVNPAYYKEPANPRTYFTNRDVHEMEIISKATELKIPLYGTCRGLQILTVAAGGKLVQHQSNDLGEHLLKYKDFNGQDFSNYSISNFLKEQTPKITKSLNKTLQGSQILASKNLTVLKKSTLKAHINQLAIDHLLYSLELPKLPLIVTSAHHQAAYPHDTLKNNDYCILSWTEGLHTTHQDGNCKELDIPEDVEIEAMLLPTIQAYGIQGHPEWMVDAYNSANKQFEKSFNNLVENNSLKMRRALVEDCSRHHFTGSLILSADLEDFTDTVIAKDLVNMLLYLNSYLNFLSGFKVLNSEFQVLSSSKLLNLIEATITNSLKVILYKDFLRNLSSYIKLGDVESYNKYATQLAEGLKTIEEYRLTKDHLKQLESFLLKNVLDRVPENILQKFPLFKAKKTSKNEVLDYYTSAFDSYKLQYVSSRGNNVVIAAEPQIAAPHIGIADDNDDVDQAIPFDIMAAGEEMENEDNEF